VLPTTSQATPAAFDKVFGEAVERGEIAKSRYESYCMLYEEVAAQKLWK
jgi:putative ribosome biogenesis GTPase RsgA